MGGWILGDAFGLKTPNLHDYIESAIPSIPSMDLDGHSFQSHPSRVNTVAKELTQKLSEVILIPMDSLNDQSE